MIKRSEKGQAAILVLVSWAALTYFIEPRGETTHNQAAHLNLRAHVRSILKTDRAFRLNAIGRILVGESPSPELAIGVGPFFHCVRWSIRKR